MIYFIQNLENKNVKIGYTKNIANRMKNLQTANSEKLRLVFWMEGDKNFEKKLHDLFIKDRIQGEWFSESIIEKFLNTNFIY